MYSTEKPLLHFKYRYRVYDFSLIKRLGQRKLCVVKSIKHRFIKYYLLTIIYCLQGYWELTGSQLYEYDNRELIHSYVYGYGIT